MDTTLNGVPQGSEGSEYITKLLVSYLLLSMTSEGNYRGTQQFMVIIPGSGKPLVSTEFLRVKSYSFTFS